MKVLCRQYFFRTSLVLLLFATFSLYSCGSKKEEPKPEWEYKPKSIKVACSADLMLNEFNGSSHALQVVIYQFDNINKFTEFAEYRDGLKKLLKAQNFDPTVQAVKKFFIDPGQKKEFILDRAEKSKWVGIVAGYFNLTPGRATVFFEIPHKVEKQGMIFFKKEVAVIEDIHIELQLMKHDIRGILLDE